MSCWLSQYQVEGAGCSRPDTIDLPAASSQRLRSRGRPSRDWGLTTTGLVAARLGLQAIVVGRSCRSAPVKRTTTPSRQNEKCKCRMKDAGASHGTTSRGSARRPSPFFIFHSPFFILQPSRLVERRQRRLRPRDRLVEVLAGRVPPDEIEPEPRAGHGRAAEPGERVQHHRPLPAPCSRRQYSGSRTGNVAGCGRSFSRLLIVS